MYSEGKNTHTPPRIVDRRRRVVTAAGLCAVTKNIRRYLFFFCLLFFFFLANLDLTSIRGAPAPGRPPTGLVLTRICTIFFCLVFHRAPRYLCQVIGQKPWLANVVFSETMREMHNRWPRAKVEYRTAFSPFYSKINPKRSMNLRNPRPTTALFFFNADSVRLLF